MVIDKRRHLRYNFICPIECILDPSTPNEVLKGETNDISNSGFCLHTSNLLNVGQELIIKSILPTYSQVAVVRWIMNLDESTYKLGLEFKNK